MTCAVYKTAATVMSRLNARYFKLIMVKLNSVFTKQDLLYFLS